MITRIVREFYEKFGQSDFIQEEGRCGLTEDFISSDRLDLKTSLIAEEFIELAEAVYGSSFADKIRQVWDERKSIPVDEWKRDVVGAADATADLAYVIEGFNIEAGIPTHRVLEEVHASNMSKLDSNGKPIISRGMELDGKPLGKILKSESFFEPNIADVILTQEV